MAMITAEVTTVSRNSATRRTREDTDGHDYRANQVKQDTGGPAGILKDTSLRRFGTMRPRVQIPGPRHCHVSGHSGSLSHDIVEELTAAKGLVIAARIQG